MDNHNTESHPEPLPEPERELERKALPVEEILNLSPKEMANYLNSLEEQGTLEEFLEQAVEDKSLLAQFSYWEKWLEKDQQKLLESIIERKREIYPPESESLPLELEKDFSEEDLRLIFANMKAVQLTYGCSKGCSFCGFDAVKGAREHIPYSQLVNMFKKYGHQLSKGHPFLYWASEPSDYASKEGLEDKTYQDVHQLAIKYGGYEPSITSFNFSQEWMDFMASKTSNYPVGDRRLSVYGMKEEGVKRIKLRVVESEDSNLKKGAGFQNIKVTGGYPSTQKPGDTFTLKHVKGMGKSFEEQEAIDDIPKSGIACVDGTLLTPRGLFNMFVVPISKEYPQGVIIVPLEKITDEPVKEGEDLQEVMRRSIMWGKYSHEGAMTESQNAYQKYKGTFPKRAMIYGKSKKYRVDIDQDGKIVKSDELDYRPEERLHPEITSERENKMMKEGLGIFFSWDEAFSKARELLKEQKIQSIATVSLDEFKRGSYVATPLSGMGFSEEESLDNLKNMAPMLYPDKNRFYLALKKMPTNHPDFPEGEISMLVIVYVEPGEKLDE